MNISQINISEHWNKENLCLQLKKAEGIDPKILFKWLEFKKNIVIKLSD